MVKVVTWKDFMCESVVAPNKAPAVKVVNARVAYDHMRHISYDHKLREVESGREVGPQRIKEGAPSFDGGGLNRMRESCHLRQFLKKKMRGKNYCLESVV